MSPFGIIFQNRLSQRLICYFKVKCHHLVNIIFQNKMSSFGLFLLFNVKWHYSITIRLKSYFKVKYHHPPYISKLNETIQGFIIFQSKMSPFGLYHIL